MMGERLVPSREIIENIDAREPLPGMRRRSAAATNLASAAGAIV